MTLADFHRTDHRNLLAVTLRCGKAAPSSTAEMCVLIGLECVNFAPLVYACKSVDIGKAKSA